MRNQPPVRLMESRHEHPLTREWDYGDFGKVQQKIVAPYSSFPRGDRQGGFGRVTLRLPYATVELDIPPAREAGGLKCAKERRVMGGVDGIASHAEFSGRIVPDSGDQDFAVGKANTGTGHIA